MDRAQASRLVGKLQALAADPAATEAEKALARAKTEELSARFGFGLAEQRRAGRQARRRYRIDRLWIGSLDPTQIDASPPVEVEHWWSALKVDGVDIGWWREALPQRQRHPVNRKIHRR
jgi:hypothetical protein